MRKYYLFFISSLLITGSIFFIYKKDYFKNNFFYTVMPLLNRLIYNYDQNCLPEKIDFVPENSTIIIGHAYGSHKGSELRGNTGIAPHVKRFYDLNKKNIQALIFSGDVLKKPSMIKWRNFYSTFEEDIKIYIAPGNHDISGLIDKYGNNSFDLITHKIQLNKFPFPLIIDNDLYIIDDSNKLVNSLEEIYKLIKLNPDYKNVFVIRHHVLPLSLKNASNGKGIQPFIKDEFFANYSEINNIRKINFIYGDGGALISKPRIACLNIANANHIVSGIGELKKDTILIVNNGKIYRKEI